MLVVVVDVVPFLLEQFLCFCVAAAESCGSPLGGSLVFVYRLAGSSEGGTQCPWAHSEDRPFYTEGKAHAAGSDRGGGATMI